METVITIELFKFHNEGSVAEWFWCRRTTQFKYCRQEGIDRWMGQRLNGLDPWRLNGIHTEDASVLDMYYCGFLRPNYQLPSTIVRMGGK